MILLAPAASAAAPPPAPPDPRPPLSSARTLTQLGREQGVVDPPLLTERTGMIELDPPAAPQGLLSPNAATLGRGVTLHTLAAVRGRPSPHAVILERGPTVHPAAAARARREVEPTVLVLSRVAHAHHRRTGARGGASSWKAARVSVARGNVALLLVRVLKHMVVMEMDSS